MNSFRFNNCPQCVGIVLIWCVLALSISVSVNASNSPVRVAAASSMRFVLDDLLEAYSATTGQSNIQSIYGSSGNLYRQILQGAPYDVFLSADSQYIEDLQAANMVDRSALFAIGTLVLHGTNDVAADELLPALTNAISMGSSRSKDLKIAIGNPVHAPFGKAAKQVLLELGVWNEARPYLIIAENVSQAAQFARSGAVTFAFVAQSLVEQLQGHSEVVPQEYYSPLQLKIAVLRASPSASSFVEFTRSDEAKKYFEKYKLRWSVSDVE